MRSAENRAETKGFHVLIAAAGSGVRFGGGRPKQYALLNGKPLLRHTLDVFINHPDLSSLRVIINADHQSLYNEAVAGLDLPPPIYGSDTRKSSIYNGLNGVSHLKDNDILLVHDAARPLVCINDITKLALEANKTGAATLATPVTDTLRHESGNTVERDGLWTIQTPQGFHYSILKNAHEAAKNDNATDDAGLVTTSGRPVALVEGSRNNIKITRPEDIELAEKLLQKNFDIRTGMGFDVHAFEKNDPTRPLILCGIKINHQFGLAGHSDADVGLHAITDALLGAIAEGDIGQHFPPSNMAFKDMNSDIFLKRAAELARKKGAVIQNIDVTIICEAPKIGPHREAMQKRIAEILGLNPSRIGVKATTTEQLGFTGRGEGIAAQAVVTVKIPEAH